ncbi:hypothetical protein Tco_1167511 [Tanacetum coccineum]
MENPETVTVFKLTEEHWAVSNITSTAECTSEKGVFNIRLKEPETVGIKAMVWKSVQYGVSKGLDTVYWGFLGVRTTLDIFQNIILIPYLEYGVLSPLDTAY